MDMERVQSFMSRESESAGFQNVLSKVLSTSNRKSMSGAGLPCVSAVVAVTEVAWTTQLLHQCMIQPIASHPENTLPCFLTQEVS